MVKRSTIGAILGAVALGIVASVIIRNPGNIISSLGPAPTISSGVVSPPLNFSQPLPFKSIEQQRAEFDFGFVERTLATAGRPLSQTSCSGGRSCTSGGDINRATAQARAELSARGFTNIVTGTGTARAIGIFATNTFVPRLTSV